MIEMEVIAIDPVNSHTTRAHTATKSLPDKMKGLRQKEIVYRALSTPTTMVSSTETELERNIPTSKYR